MTANPKQLVQDRPAETATPVATAAALLICKALGVDDAYTVGYVALLVSFTPAAVTWLVNLRKSKA